MTSFTFAVHPLIHKGLNKILLQRDYTKKKNKSQTTKKENKHDNKQ